MNDPDMSHRPEKQILVAGVGNVFLQDDGFGTEVARVLGARGVPSGVTVLDFGTGGLKLAYEVMRGYDALVLVDISRQGGTPARSTSWSPTRRRWRVPWRKATRSIPTGWIRAPCCDSSKRWAAGPARWS